MVRESIRRSCKQGSRRDREKKKYRDYVDIWLKRAFGEWVVCLHMQAP